MLKALAPQLDERPRDVLGWAVYLGVSWTWCIGMFFPVLLVRQFGLWGWVVFAIPNVVGAAAMGRVLPDAAASARVTGIHAAACAAFSAVTVIFQITFVGWVGVALIGHWAGLLMAAVAVAVVLAGRWRWGEVVAAGVVFAFSALAFALSLYCARGLPTVGFPPVMLRFSTELAWLAPVIVFGFLLCPYLDLTFHRARQATSPQVGARAFAYGFGGPFLLMIVFTLWYARLLAPLASGQSISLPGALRWLIAGHLCVQCGYTIGVHWRAIRGEPDAAQDARAVKGGLIGFVCSIMVPVFAWVTAELLDANLVPSELIYRLFMGFYGLVFPAYVWLCVVPNRGAAPDERQGKVLLWTLFVAGPMFWVGFVRGPTIWLGPGIAVVLLARLFVRRERLAPLTRKPAKAARKRRL